MNDLVEYFIKTTPARERAIQGLSLKTMFLRLNDEDTKEVIEKLNKIKQMTNEEYEIYNKLNG